MKSFAARCGVHSPARATACKEIPARLKAAGIDTVRVAWGDLHGSLRSKTLMAHAVPAALLEGITMVSTLMLKDSSDRSAYAVFEPGALDDLPGFSAANNLVLLPDPASLRPLPWAPGTAWMLAQPWFADATVVSLDTRQVLKAALHQLAAAGYGLRCGLEIEFHIYRIEGENLDPAHAAWPAEPPTVSLVHPGYHLLSDAWADRADEPLQIVRRTAQQLGLLLRSLEIELGPSQVEAVFEATDALTAADHMLLFRNGVTQALRRAGYHASFMCLPPFSSVMASGWHLHQSVVDLQTGRNAFMRDAPAQGSSPSDAQYTLSALGEQWLAGLLAHGRGMAVFCAPTINGYGRFRPNAMAPQAVLWGRDNRGAMLRVLGDVGDASTRIENRIGEPLANPYLYIASQIHAGLDGIAQGLSAGPATASAYGDAAQRLPNSLAEALDALAADVALVQAFGTTLVNWLTRIKRAELARFDAAEDPHDWQRREYFSRF